MLPWLLLATGIILFTAGNVEGGGPPISFNQQFVEKTYELEIDQPDSVFARVFSQLAPEVYVYPTENYYYFSFSSSGRHFMGNLRLEPGDRDEGRIHFAYFEYGNTENWYYRHYSSENDVAVNRLQPLRYRVTYQNKAVIFQLNDLSQEKPASLELLPGEVFIGRSFDESGFQFLLVYNRTQRNFLWLLEDIPDGSRKYIPYDNSLEYDLPSGFVFYHDKANDRRLLIGVHSLNVSLNNYYDGPFDQLPDNFITETTFANFVQEAYPYTWGRIDSHGRFIRDGQTTRMAITPYLDYDLLEDLVEHVGTVLRAGGTPAEIYARLCPDHKAGGPPDATRERDVVARTTLTGQVK